MSLLDGVEAVASEEAPAESQAPTAAATEVTATTIEGKPAPVEAEAEPGEFLLEKFKSVDDQAKAYAELEKRFGGFTGAPEDYQVVVPDGIVPEGSDLEVNLADDDPALQTFKEIAKDANMNQSTFDKIMGLYMKQQVDLSVTGDQERKEFATQEMKALGDEAPKLLGQIVAWSNNHVPEEHKAGFNDLATTAAGTKALMHLISMTKNAPIPDNFTPGVATGQGISQADVDAERFKVDDYGNRLMSSSPAHREKVRKMTEQLMAQG